MFLNHLRTILITILCFFLVSETERLLKSELFALSITRTINASQEKNKVQVYGEKNYTDDAMADVQPFLLKDNMPIVLKDGFRKKKFLLFLRKELSSWFKKHNEPFSGIFNYRSIVNFECFLSRYNDFYSRLN